MSTKEYTFKCEANTAEEIISFFLQNDGFYPKSIARNCSPFEAYRATAFKAAQNKYIFPQNPSFIGRGDTHLHDHEELFL